MEKSCPGCKKTLPIDRYTQNNKVYAKCMSCRIKLINKKNRCNQCGIRALYNYTGQTNGIRCSTHKETDMVDVMHKKCEKCKNKTPSYNIQGESVPKFCSECKEYDMVDVKHKMCENCRLVIPTFNYIGKTVGRFCSNCKESNMINVVDKKCDKCKTKQPSFNIKGNTIPKFCNDCREPEMVNVINKRCEKCKNKNPCYNYDGETMPIFCGDCKEPDMVNVVSKRCIKCKLKIPAFNMEGTHTAKFCKDCKEPCMVDVISKRCIKCNIKRPIYNNNGETLPLLCRDCKEDDMVNVISKRCIKCKEKHPSYNFEGLSNPLFCFACKELNMINVQNPSCTEQGCRKRAKYALPGVIPSHCSTHKTDGMMKHPRRRCQGTEKDECKENATHGIDEPLHCEDHAQEGEYCLAERKCHQCGALDILNKQGVCVNICSLVEKDLLMKKRVKKHEEFIGKLLEAEIDVKSTVIEMWRDSVIDSSCTLCRPDFAYHCGTHVVIVEVDEEQHRSYTNCGYTKEEKLKAEQRRMYQIGTIFQGSPIVFLRYNPDSYKDVTDKKGAVPNKKRHDVLVRWVKKCIRAKWEHGIHVKYLFYDGYDEMDGNFHRIIETDVM